MKKWLKIWKKLIRSGFHRVSLTLCALNFSLPMRRRDSISLNTKSSLWWSAAQERFHHLVSKLIMYGICTRISIPNSIEKTALISMASFSDTAQPSGAVRNKLNLKEYIRKQLSSTWAYSIARDLLQYGNLLMRDSKIASSVAPMLIFRDLLPFLFTSQRTN